MSIADDTDAYPITGERRKSPMTQPPAEREFVRMRTLCEQAGLVLVERDFETHWQILSSAGKPLVDYWPTTGKLRRNGAKSGVKAERGTPESAVRAAVAIKSCEPKATSEPTDRMSRRDYFAAAALTGLCAHSEYGQNITEVLAVMAYEQADAMLAAREKGQPQ